MEITMPPLRARGQDIVVLAKKILNTISKRFQRAEYRFDDDALKLLQEYHWPGNVRELENVIERAIILSNDQRITCQDLGIHSVDSSDSDSPIASELSMDEYFVEFVKKHQRKFNETELSARLGISRKNLWERRQRLGIPRGN
jgi:DNA-binding NtrC family response regulator